MSPSRRGRSLHHLVPVGLDDVRASHARGAKFARPVCRRGPIGSPANVLSHVQCHSSAGPARSAALRQCHAKDNVMLKTPKQNTFAKDRCACELQLAAVGATALRAGSPQGSPTLPSRGHIVPRLKGQTSGGLLLDLPGGLLCSMDGFSYLQRRQRRQSRQCTMSCAGFANALTVRISWW